MNIRGVFAVGAALIACVAGCDGDEAIGPADVEAADDAAITWHREVAPLLADRCGSCHRQGGIAPFSVETYAEAQPWGAAIVASVEAGTMPPFYAVSSDECDMR